MRFHVHGRELYATGPDALGQQLWLQTWLAINSVFVRPGPSVIAKATIPEETYPVDEENPNLNGTVGRAEVNFDFTLEGDDPDAIQLLANDVTLAMASNEVNGWVGGEAV